MAQQFLKPTEGGWGVLVSREEYVRFLRKCASEWESGGPSWRPDPEHASRIRARADEIERG